jgi:hypothetical protein
MLSIVLGSDSAQKRIENLEPVRRSQHKKLNRLESGKLTHKLPHILSNAEMNFIKRLKNEDWVNIKEYYHINYIRTLKHRILNKKRKISNSIVLVNTVPDKLQSLQL